MARAAGCFGGVSAARVGDLEDPPSDLDAPCHHPSADQRVQASAAASSAGPSASSARLASQSRCASPATSVPMNTSPAPERRDDLDLRRGQLRLAGAADHRALGPHRHDRELGAHRRELRRGLRADRRRP